MTQSERQQAYCPKCKFTVAWPSSLTNEDKRHIAEFAHAYLFIEGVKFMRQNFSLDLKEAKGLMNHVTREKGKCQRCKQPVQAEVSTCENCHSLNLDW